jgi:hypothetical protein
MFGCSKDDPDDPDTTVPDPPGTITANLSEKSDIDIDSYFGGNATIYWMAPDNFYLRGYGRSYGYTNTYVSICNLGAMSGLGNITKIPTSGFTAPSSLNRSVACEEGHGYVIKIEQEEDGSNPEYLRLYVVEPIVNTAGGIMGAKVKYQHPFEP